MDDPDRCLACDASLTGAYCSTCGERRPLPEDETLWHVLKEQLVDVTSADGKLWRSLRLLFSPGTLTAEYFAGRRTRYLRPVRLFLVLNVVLFFVLSFLSQNPLLGELATQRGAVGEYAVAAADRTQAAWGGDEAVFESLFDQRARTLASSLIAVMIPALALLFALAFRWGAGARHLVFATHALAALVAGYLAIVGLALVITSIVSLFGVSASMVSWLEYALVVLMALAVGAYLHVGARRVYGLAPARAGIGAAAITLGGLPAILMGYRVLLFWLTLWTLDLPNV